MTTGRGNPRTAETIHSAGCVVAAAEVAAAGVLVGAVILIGTVVGARVVRAAAGIKRGARIIASATGGTYREVTATLAAVIVVGDGLAETRGHAGTHQAA